MTAQTTIPARTAGPLASIGNAAARIFTSIVEKSPNARSAREAQLLFALSDAELAAQGLSRDKILELTFGPRIAL